jgi:hypothetical protein
MLDTKAKIARFCCKLGKRLTGDRFVFELMDGPTTGKRIGGCVSWDGSRWRVIVNSSTSDWRFFRCSLHELAHVVLGHVEKICSPDPWLDRAAIRGAAPVYAQARMKGWAVEGESLRQEASAEAWAETYARLAWDDLQAYLGEREKS